MVFLYGVMISILIISYLSSHLRHQYGIKNKSMQYIIAVVAEWQPNNTENPNSTFIFESLSFWLDDNNIRIIPILPWQSELEIKNILDQSEGVIFMGGMRDLKINGKFENFSKQILDYGKLNQIPILGICQGYELILLLESNNNNLFSIYNNTPVRFQPDSFYTNSSEYAKDPLFKNFNKTTIFDFENKNVNAHYHMLGISLDTFNNEPNLVNNYKISSLGTDRNNLTFINSVYHNTHPIHLLQFHPEVGTTHNRLKNKFKNRTEDEIYSSEFISISIFKGFENLLKERHLIIKDKIDLSTLHKLTVEERNLVYDDFYGFSGFKIIK